MNQKISGPSCCCFLILLLMITCVTASAQYSDSLGGNWNNPASAMITNIIMDRYAQRRLARNLAAKHSGGNSTAPSSPANSAQPAAKLNDASLHFRPTGTQLKTGEIANLIDPGNPQLSKLMGALLNEYEKNARAAGKPNDLALALSFFFATNASVYHDGGQPTDPQMLELRETIAEALLEGGAFKGITDRQKQEMYEALVIYTGIALAAYEEGKQSGNADSVKSGQALAGQNLLAITGISPDKINFTDQGLSIEREPTAATATASQSSTAPTSPPASPAASIHAGKLVMEFEGNEVRANQMYVGKRIRVNGTVNSVDILKDGRLTLTFHSPAAGYAHTRCFFNKSQSSRLSEMQGGQEVIVEGTVRGFGDDLKRYVEMENCIIP